MITGSAPASTAVCTRAMGVRPSSRAFSDVVISSAAEPSEICEALPAVMTPSGLNGVFSVASVSTVEPRRMPSSCCTRPAVGRHGRDLLVEPALVLGGRGLLVGGHRELVELLAREAPLLGDHLGADALVGTRRRSGPGTGRRRDPALAVEAPMGTRDIDSTPPATTTSYCPAISPAAAKCTDCWDEPHWRSIGEARHGLRPPRGQHRGAGDVTPPAPRPGTRSPR